MRNPLDDYEFRRELCDWLRANDVDPGTIPADERISIADGQMTMRQATLNERGKTIVVDNQILTHVITVPVKVAPPPLVEEWLRPRCPTCGR